MAIVAITSFNPNVEAGPKLGQHAKDTNMWLYHAEPTIKLGYHAEASSMWGQEKWAIGKWGYIHDGA